MAQTGFTVDGNLEKISGGKLAMSNLLSAGSKPFTFDDLDIFRSNNIQTSKMDFIPNNHIFAVPVDESFSTTDSVIKLKNVSDSSPGLTLNLSVQAGDILLPADIKISSISREKNIDRGTLTLDSAIGSSSIGNDTPIKIKKQNSASYSPAFGRFTFGTDINFSFSNGEKITSVDIKNYSPASLSQLDSPLTSGGSIYPLEVFDRAVSDNGQISFKLRKSSTNSPVLFKHESSNCPSKLEFKNDEVIRFTRLNPVTQSEFLTIVPPNFRNDGGGNDLIDVTDAIQGTAGAGLTTLYVGFEGVTGLYDIQADDLGEEPYSDVKPFQNALNDIKVNIDTAKSIIKTKLDKSKNYVNDSSEEFIVEGVLKIQDLDVVNSPSGILGFNDTPVGLAPASYINEFGDFNRAFSTFDGPWESNSTTSDIGTEPAESIFTKGDSPDHPDFVEQMSVNELVFKNTFHLEKFSSPMRIDTANDIDVNSSTLGFDFKMPIKVEETDPDSGDKVLVDYFLLLKQES